MKIRYFYDETADDAEYKYYPFLIAILEHYVWKESPRTSHDVTTTAGRTFTELECKWGVQDSKEMKKSSWLYTKEYIRCGELFRSEESYLADTLDVWITNHPTYKEISERDAALVLL